MKLKKKLVALLLPFFFLAGCETPVSSTTQPSNTTPVVESSSTDNTNTSISDNSSTEKSSVLDSSIQDSSVDSTSSTSYSSDLELKSYWNSLDLSTYGSTLRSSLRSLIKATGNKTIGYSTNNSVLAQSDKALNGKGIIPFYREETESTTDWNKEHVWPNSRGAGKSGPGSDPHMLRPTYSKDNSSRGNSFYGQSGDGTVWDPASFGYENARGEAARIVFYVSARYSGMELSNNPNDSTEKHTMGRLDRLIEWNNKYPVTAQEIRRNEYLYSDGFGRNPFIDHPDLVNYIWDKQGLRTSQYDGNLNGGGNQGGNGGGTIVDEDPITYNIVNSIEDLDLNKEVLVVSNDPNATSEYYALTSQAKSDKLPWYLVGNSLGAMTATYKTTSDLELFTVTKTGDNYQFMSDNKYLFNYIDGTHYSIGMGATPTNDGSINWSITLDNGKAQMKGEKGVYLEYFKSSFCGYSKAPSTHISFYQIAD
jgi:endonuclease I